MAPKASPKAKLIFSPQKRQRKTVVPSAEKLEVFIIRYSEKAQLVSESFDESQAVLSNRRNAWGASHRCSIG